MGVISLIQFAPFDTRTGGAASASAPAVSGDAAEAPGEGAGAGDVKPRGAATRSG